VTVGVNREEGTVIPVGWIERPKVTWRRDDVVLPRLWRWRWRRSWWEDERCPCRCLWVRGGWRGEEPCDRPVISPLQHHVNSRRIIHQRHINTTPRPTDN